jgi:hypothetical protein
VVSVWVLVSRRKQRKFTNGEAHLAGRSKSHPKAALHPNDNRPLVVSMEPAKHSNPERAEYSDAARNGHVLQLESLPGVWINTNRDSRGIVKVVVATRNSKLVVRAFGAADPEPNDWGETEADHIYAGSISSRIAAGFTAWYHFDFSQIHLQANWNQGLLVLATFTSFTDGSRRSDYFSREFFHRELTQQKEK